MRHPTTLLLAAALVAAGGCASTGTAAGDADAAPRSARSASSTTVLAPADVAAATQQNMRDVITALRPRWLQNTSAGSIRGMGANGEISVYVNGRPSGGIDVLTGIDKTAVERVLYYPLSEAQNRYGSVVRGPIIDVRLKIGG